MVTGWMVAPHCNWESRPKDDGGVDTEMTEAITFKPRHRTSAVLRFFALQTIKRPGHDYPTTPLPQGSGRDPSAFLKTVIRLPHFYPESSRTHEKHWKKARSLDHPPPCNMIAEKRCFVVFGITSGALGVQEVVGSNPAIPIHV